MFTSHAAMSASHSSTSSCVPPSAGDTVDGCTVVKQKENSFYTKVLTTGSVDYFE